MRAQLIWLTCAACSIALPPAEAQTISFAPTTHAAAAGVRGAVSVDINGDGWLDIATANMGRNTVWIMMNRGSDGGFTAVPEIPVGIGPFDIAAGDADRDGIPDLLVTTPSEPAITLLLMRRDGSARARFQLFGPVAWGATLADVSRDGILDLVYSEYNRGIVVVIDGDGTGNFPGALREFPVSANPQDVVAADFNHDGFLDIAVASSTTSSLNVLYGTATRSFTRRTFAAGRSLNVLETADINADGWLDLAAAASSSHMVAFFRGSATGFALAGTRATGATPRGITSGDFNHDGRPDFATSNFSSSSVTVLLGRRDGVALADRWGDLPAGHQTRGIVAGDFDHDGRNDFAAGSQGSQNFVVFSNDTAFVRSGFAFSRREFLSDTGESQCGGFAPVAVADFNENGILDLLCELGVVLDGVRLVRFDGVGRATADFNRDGHTDIIGNVNGFQVWLGNGRGEFTRGFGRSGIQVTEIIRVGDFDRDGRADAVAIGNVPGVRWVLHVLRQADPEPVLTTIPLPGFPVDLQVADVNRDGKLDVLTAERGQGETLAIRLGDGTGRFGSPTNVSLPSQAWRFKVADVNEDGRPDVVLAADCRITVILAQAGGGWAAPVQFEVTPECSTSALDVLVGDYDNDGHADVFAGNGALLAGSGQGTFSAPAEFETGWLDAIAVDWNRDGLLDVVTGDGAVLNERRAVNRRPVANAGTDFSITYFGLFIQDEGSLHGFGSSDPDLHRLMPEWRDENGVVFSRSLVEVNMPVRNPGTYTFTLTVRDGRGGESTDAINITVLPEEEIVLYAHHNPLEITGNWRVVDDPTAAEGQRVFYPNAGAAKVTTALANPAGFVEKTFVADPTQTYKLWVRLKAQDNRGANDSIHLQFSGAIDTSGRPNYRIGTTEGLAVNLEECLGCGVSGWGWEDDGWGAVNKNGTLVRFPEGGIQRLRIQVREDGVSVDQIVLSAVKYRTTRPGAAKNDTTILARPQQFP
jgi:hypothetical protein